MEVRTRRSMIIDYSLKEEEPRALLGCSVVFGIEEVRINGRSRKETESECVLSTSMLNLVLVVKALRPVASC